MSDSGHHERERFFGAAKLIAAMTVLSRILGMVRDMAIVWLGASRFNDAFVLAFKIPNLFRRLFGEGALSAAFVPIFTDAAENDGPDRARAIFANAFALLAAILAGLCVVVGAALMIWSWVSPGAWDRQLVIQLTGVMLPFSLTICLLALCSAALNCRGHFAYPSFAPIILNIVMIAAAWFVAPMLAKNPSEKFFVLAGSVTLAGVLQLLIAILLLKRYKFVISLRIFPMEPAVGKMFKLLVPMLLGLGFLQLSELANDLVAWTLSSSTNGTIMILGMDTGLARPLDAGTLTRLYAAQRLYQFPMGVLAISLGVAVFPLLARYAARNETPNLLDSLNRAVRLATMEGLAAGVGMFLLAEPIIAMIFRHGEFSAADTARTAFVLQAYLLGMWAYCNYHIFVRAFYAIKDTATPMKISCVLAIPGLAIAAGLAFVPQIGAAAFGLAMATIFSANSLILATILRRRLGAIGAKKIIVSVIRSIIACGAMAAAIIPIKTTMGGMACWQIVAVCVPAGAAAFVVAAWIMRAPELRELRAKKPAKTDSAASEI